MHELIAQAFIDELACSDMEKLAFELNPQQFDRITGAVGERWRQAGISEENITDLMGDLRDKLDELAVQASSGGKSAYRGAQERARDLVREFNAFAPGRKITGSKMLSPPGVDTPAQYTFNRVQQRKPSVGNRFVDIIREKVGLEGKNKLVGSDDFVAKIDSMMGETPQHLQRELRHRGNELIGADAMKSLKKGTSGGIVDAARKTLLPGLRAMPAPLKVGAGLAAGYGATQLLFGDDKKPTIRVG